MFAVEKICLCVIFLAALIGCSRNDADVTTTFSITDDCGLKQNGYGLMDNPIVFYGHKKIYNDFSHCSVKVYDEEFKKTYIYCFLSTVLVEGKGYCMVDREKEGFLFQKNVGGGFACGFTCVKR